MPATYEPIATTTLGTAASSITFNSIGTAYSDLRWVLVASNATALKDLNITYNGVTTATYNATHQTGDGTNPSTGTYSAANNIRVASSIGLSPIPSMFVCDVIDYQGTTFKQCLIRSAGNQNTGGGDVIQTIGVWRSTSAITSITLTCESPVNFAVGTTATLYGIKAA
jgi:hypothetical protein